MKRKLAVSDDAIYLEDDNRSAKRISPFLNTPIQKKEEKRRILRLSMRKMREIDCPESFLRRSVLINNLARSLQDDLKDDKLWSRWDWAADMETAPYRTHNQDTSGSRSGQASSCSQISARYLGQHNAAAAGSHWSASAHAHWLNADDVHMSASERERVSREMTQSHDRLAETVDSLTSFDADYTSSDKQGVKDSLVNTARSRNHYVTSGGDITNVSCSCGGDNLLTSGGVGTYAAPPSPYRSGRDPDGCIENNDVNRNNNKLMLLPPSCSGFRTKMDAVPNLDMSHLDGYPSTEYSCTLPSTSISQPVHIADISGTPRYTDGHLAKLSGYEKDADKDPWTLPCLEYPEELGTTYLDMTSNSVCRVPNEPSLLDTLDSSIPSLQTAMHSTTTAGVDVSSHLTDSGQPLSVTSSSSNGHHLKIGYSTADMTSSTLDGIVSGGHWNSSSIADDVINSPVSTSFSLGTTVSCSTEAEHPEYVSSTDFSDPDKFSSQSLRDFDIIYNNLVSVLIGGN